MSRNPFQQLRKFVQKRNELGFFKKATPEEIFTRIYDTNKWGHKDTRSGKGSSLDSTLLLREQLPALLQDLQTTTLLDIPCGDFHWMQQIDLPVALYIGADIVKPLIAANSLHYSNEQRQFAACDLLHDLLPRADSILCRECLVHLSFGDINLALANIKSSGAKFLLTTNFPDITENINIVTGKHRRLNFCRAPWHWPPPLMTIMEQPAESRRGRKDLAVWRIADLP